MRPHSFVLVDQPANLPPAAPDHALEQEPGLDWVLCPLCDGELEFVELSLRVSAGERTPQPACSDAEALAILAA